jgi:hypothetical protein
MSAERVSTQQRSWEGMKSVLTMLRALLIEAAMYRKNLRHRHDAANLLNEALPENMQHSCLERR